MQMFNDSQSGAYTTNQENLFLAFCPAGLILSLIGMGGVLTGMDDAFNLIISLSGFSLAAVPLVVAGLRKMALCTSENFSRFITSVGSRKQIYLGVNAKKYCDAFNYTLYCCIFVLINCLMQVIAGLPLSDQWVITAVCLLWGIFEIVFYSLSLVKVRWKVYAGFSFTILLISFLLQPFFQWLRSFVHTPYELSEYGLISVSTAVLSGVLAIVAFSVYKHYSANCVAVPIYLTEAPAVVEIVTVDGTVFDRAETLFYPDFEKDGVRLTFYNGRKTRYYRYEELSECTIVSEDGKSLSLDDLKNS